MRQSSIKHTNASKATLTRLPIYYRYLKENAHRIGHHISATKISKDLQLGEIQVRKDLGLASGVGRPKVGYVTQELIATLEKYLGYDVATPVILVGVGKLGSALLSYSDFSTYGLKITAAFDSNSEKIGSAISGVPVLNVNEMEAYCRVNNVHIGIICTPVDAAQTACDLMVAAGIKAIWNLAPATLKVDENVRVMQENLALSLAFLNMQTKFPQWNEAEKETL